MPIRITNIQHFSLHDGPGIRTTVFLKGCNLRCPWCCNPENISYNIEEYTENKIRKEFGYDISADKLEEEILKDEIFYSKNRGGVTFSGGEPLLQIKELEPLLKRLKEKDINICFETALHIPNKLFKIAMEYADEIYIDIKILNKKEDLEVLNGNIKQYYTNLKYIKTSDFKEEQITFRIPLNIEYTLKEDNFIRISELINEFPKSNIEIFKIHNLGKNKYELLNMNLQEFSEINDHELIRIAEKLKEYNKNVKIIKI